MLVDGVPVLCVYHCPVAVAVPVAVVSKLTRPAADCSVLVYVGFAFSVSFRVLLGFCWC